MGKQAKVLLCGMGATTVALLLGVAIWIAVNSRDIAPVDMSDLVPVKVEVPDQENADLLFAKAFQSFQWPKDDRRVEAVFRGETWDEEYAADWVSRNAETLTLLKQGLDCPQYQSRHETGLEESGPRWQRYRMAKLLALKAIYELRTGHSDASWETSWDLVRFGSLVQANPTGIVDHASALVALDRGFQAVARLLCERPLNEAELVSSAQRLNQLPPLEQGWLKAMRLEYELISGGIDKAVSTYAILGGYLLQPNRAKADFACFCRRMIENASRPYCQMDLPAGETNDFGKWRGIRLLLRPNGMWRLAQPRPDYLNSHLGRRCEIQSHLDGLRLTVACRLYEVRHGRLPEALDALVPELIAKVPLDPFDGKPFRYVREDAVVYSVGRDLTDSWILGKHAPDVLLSGRVPGKTDDLVYHIDAQAK